MRRLAAWGALTLLLFGCTPPRQEGVLRVAVDARRPPLAFLDAQKRVVGLEVDLIRGIAAQEGWPVEVINVPEEGFLSGVEDLSIRGGLARNEWDVVLGQPQSNRLRDRWALTEPYLSTGPVLAIALGAGGPRQLDASWSGGLGLLPYGDAPTLASRQGIPSTQLRFYRDPGDALEDLVEGRIAGALIDRLAVAGARADNERLQLLVAVGDPWDAEALVAVLRKDDVRLERINARLAAMTEDQRTALEEKWFLR